jgi:hypothetical protein
MTGLARDILEEIGLIGCYVVAIVVCVIRTGRVADLAPVFLLSRGGESIPGTGMRGQDPSIVLV